MQVVVHMSDKLYERIMETDSDTCATFTESAIVKAIQNGQVLPKGHGNLKDTKEILDRFDKTYKEKVNIVPDNLAEGFVQCEKLIKTAPPIIKAGDEETGRI